MKRIDSVSETGLVLFLEDTGKQSSGTKDDCLAYAYKYQDGNCFAYIQNIRPQYDKNKTIGNSNYQSNNKVGRANNLQAGKENVVLGKGHQINRDGSNSIVKGRNAYSENYGEDVYGNNIQKNIAREVNVQFSGLTTDATVTELFIGNEGNNQFSINPDYSTSYFVEWNAVAINVADGTMWSRQNFQAFRYIRGTFVEVGSHSAITLRDAALDYDFTITPIVQTTGNSYLKVEAEGEAGHTVSWNSTIKITEIRTKEVLLTNSVLNPDFLGTPTWQEINQNATNIITIPNNATNGGCKIDGDGTRNLAARYTPLFWGTDKWKITFDLTGVTGKTLGVQVRENNQNSSIFATEGTHSYYVDTIGGANFIQFMVNSTTGARACVINNIKAQIVS